MSLKTAYILTVKSWKTVFSISKASLSRLGINPADDKNFTLMDAAAINFLKM
jgi:hypothetical protein